MKNQLAFFNRFSKFEDFFVWCQNQYTTVDGGFSFEINNQTFNYSLDKTKYCNVFNFPVEEYRLKTFAHYFYNRMRFIYGFESSDPDFEKDIKSHFTDDESILLCGFYHTDTIWTIGLTLIILENSAKKYLIIAVDHYKDDILGHLVYFFDESFCSSYSQNEIKQKFIQLNYGGLMPQIVR